MTLLPTPAAWDADRGPDLARVNRPDSGGHDLLTVVERLLPTPTGRDDKGRNQRDDATCLPGAVNLLPTPTENDARNGRNITSRDPDKPRAGQVGWTLSDVAHVDRFGEYAAAIARHEALAGRPAPDPTVGGRLSPLFVEWLMCWPSGWVTDPALGLSNAQQLRILGNGVVTPQAVHAWRLLDAFSTMDEAATGALQAIT